MPLMRSAISWLKYQGEGRRTASPAFAVAIMATKKARLQPAVSEISAGETGAP